MQYEIDIEDFINDCSAIEIEEVIDILIDNGHLKESAKIDYTVYSATESMYEDALNKLHGKWNNLSKEEEEYIIALASKF
jgi:hypothetical protein